jgi:hypothetical protein
MPRIQAVLLTSADDDDLSTLYLQTVIHSDANSDANIGDRV